MKKVFEKYILGEPSGLPHNLPTTEFKSFDVHNIEEGRLYFWIQKNEDEILKSNVIFLILQDRFTLTYFISPTFSLSQFNARYNIDHIRYYDYNSDFKEEMEALLKKVEKKGFVEIPQEEIIALLTAKASSEVLAQEQRFSIYTDNMAYDIYDNMIQSWELENEKKSTHYVSAFFDDEKSQEKYLKKQLKIQLKEYEMELTDKQEAQEYLDRVKTAQQRNRDYLQQLPFKKKLLQDYPKLDACLSYYERKEFFERDNFKIVKGDLVVDGDLELDNQKESLLITGELHVKGTLFPGAKDGKNVLIVIGDVKAKNYVHNGSAYSSIIYASDLNIENITYLPAASRTWYITVAGAINTKILIHGQTKTIKDKEIHFKEDYSTAIRTLFSYELLGKRKHMSEAKLYAVLVEGKTVFTEDALDKEMVDREKSLLNFKAHLQNWGAIYYKFAGFEALHVKEGKYGNCYVGSGDEILEDVRGGTGRYCMCHESIELTPLDKKEGNGIEPASRNLAYRFLWIQWTFSSWTHRCDGPLDYWESTEQIDRLYENGKAHFPNNPNLALYWILHFGLLNDSRYEAIKEQMADSDHELIKGAIAFIDDFKQTKSFPIRIDSKDNTEILHERVQQHIASLKMATSSNQEKVHILLEQFELQPKNVVNLIQEVLKLNEKDALLQGLNERSYQDGFSYLYALYDEQNKMQWHDTFLQECWEHLDTKYIIMPDGVVQNEYESSKPKWKDTVWLMDLLEPIFDELSIENQDKALTIIVNAGSLSSERKKRFDFLLRHHKAKVAGKTFNLEDEMDDFVSSMGEKDMFVKAFIKLLKEKTVQEQIFLIKSATKQNKFSEVCDLDKTLCSYLMLLWIEQNLKAEVEEKTELAAFIVDHYELSYEDYKSNSSASLLEGKDKEEFEATMRKFLK